RHDQRSGALAGLGFAVWLTAPGLRVDRGGTVQVLVGIDQPAGHELVGAHADAERGQVVQVLRDRRRSIGPAVAGNQVYLRIRVRLVVGELPVHHGRDAVGDQVAEGGVPVLHVVLALG